MFWSGKSQEDLAKFVGVGAGVAFSNKEAVSCEQRIFESSDAMGDTLDGFKKILNGSKSLKESSGVSRNSVASLYEVLNSGKIKVSINEAKEKIKTVEDATELTFLGSSGKEKYYLDMKKDDNGFVTEYRVADPIGVVVAEEEFTPSSDKDEGKAPADVLVDLIGKLKLDEVGVKALEEADVFVMEANELVDGARSEEEREDDVEIVDADTGESNADGEEDLGDDGDMEQGDDVEGGAPTMDDIEPEPEADIESEMDMDTDMDVDDEKKPNESLQESDDLDEGKSDVKDVEKQDVNEANGCAIKTNKSEDVSKYRKELDDVQAKLSADMDKPAEQRMSQDEFMALRNKMNELMDKVFTVTSLKSKTNESKRAKLVNALRSLKEAKGVAVKDENPNKSTKALKSASIPAAKDKALPARKDDNKGKKNAPNGVSTPKATDKSLPARKDDNKNKKNAPSGVGVPKAKTEKIGGGSTTKTSISSFRGANDGFERADDFVSFVKRMSESMKKGKK